MFFNFKSNFHLQKRFFFFFACRNMSFRDFISTSKGFLCSFLLIFALFVHFSNSQSKLKQSQRVSFSFIEICLFFIQNSFFFFSYCTVLINNVTGPSFGRNASIIDTYSTNLGRVQWLCFQKHKKKYFVWMN